MDHSRTAVLLTAAALAIGLAACGGSSSDGSSSPSTPSTSTPEKTASKPPTASGALTPPGTQLKVGQDATVGWVPFSEDSGTGAKEGIDVKATVVAIEKGTIDDFANVELEPEEENSVPYYVKVKVEAVGSTEPPEDEEPDIGFDAIDDRGQEQSSVTFLGEFDRCPEGEMPRPFTNGASYESCLTYLMPGGGSIAKVQWNDGPSEANELTPYYDEPIVWEGS
jgi:hypothetical protein